MVFLGLVSLLSAPLLSLAQVSTLNPNGPASAGSPLTCYDFPKNLSVGTSGAEVALLQYFLQKEGFGIDDSEMGTFDETTFGAVKAFQEKYSNDILVPAGLNNGNGFFGKLTRAKLNTLYGCTAFKQLVVSPNNPNPSFAITNIAMDQTGIAATFCNKSKFPVPTFPARIRLNGINRDFEIDGAHNAGACVAYQFPYSTWGLYFDPGTQFTAVGIIDPYGEYKKSYNSVPLSASSTLTVPAIPGIHLSVRSVLLKNSGVQATFCNLGTVDVTSYPVNVTVNGTMKSFDIPGAYKHGSCQSMTWTYDNWGATYTPGTTYAVSVVVDPNYTYKDQNEFDNVATVIGTP